MGIDRFFEGGEIDQQLLKEFDQYPELKALAEGANITADEMPEDLVGDSPYEDMLRSSRDAGRTALAPLTEDRGELVGAPEVPAPNADLMATASAIGASIPKGAGEQTIWDTIRGFDPGFIGDFAEDMLPPSTVGEQGTSKMFASHHSSITEQYESKAVPLEARGGAVPATIKDTFSAVSGDVRVTGVTQIPGTSSTSIAKGYYAVNVGSDDRSATMVIRAHSGAEAADKLKGVSGLYYRFRAARLLAPPPEQKTQNGNTVRHAEHT